LIDVPGLTAGIRVSPTRSPGSTGGVAALLIRDIPLSITADVGFITLCGVAVLTGVIMVSAIRDLVRDGVSLETAIIFFPRCIVRRIPEPSSPGRRTWLRR